MLVAIVFHAYFDIDVEVLLAEKKLYVCDKLSIFIDTILDRLGFKKLCTRRQQNRLQSELDRRIPYQDVYKILKR